ncbi:hypothetical protein RJ639_022475 [Escallonia herrerae]|uniref:Cytochrome b561 and DOMON domain-containing protein n=1 Tax=Escallonia herrerae TaxID=1293975 RepID=A0AA88V4P9_9ASTE|nr:hypothetical protein RJ639_022475 [Escallonia herrerae]
MDSRFKVSPQRRWVLLVFVVGTVLWVPNIVLAEQSGDGALKGMAELCSVDLRASLPPPYGTLENTVCRPVWNTYLLRYSQTDDHVVTIVLSAIYTTGWVGIGFSKDGMMINSSAMVGWIGEGGHARIKQYYVGGFNSSEIIPDKGELPLTSLPPYVGTQGATIYLAFQLKFAARLRTQPILLAFSSRTPRYHHHSHRHLLTHHDDKTTILFDFSKGTIDSFAMSKDTGSIGRTRRTHGILSMLGWGLILPYGAIVARYLRHRDPLWFYLHTVIQFMGFLIAVAAVVVGVSLYGTLNAHFPAHRGIGIFALVLSILQVLAFFLRPSKDSKNRRYWNWYHHWVGRIALFFGAVNIVLGIHSGEAGNGWKITYGFLLGIALVLCSALEALAMLRRSETSANHPAFQMDPVESSVQKL